jgi:hypothetical protein
MPPNPLISSGRSIANHTSTCLSLSTLLTCLHASCQCTCMIYVSANAILTMSKKRYLKNVDTNYTMCADCRLGEQHMGSSAQGEQCTWGEGAGRRDPSLSPPSANGYAYIQIRLFAQYILRTIEFALLQMHTHIIAHFCIID